MEESEISMDSKQARSDYFRQLQAKRKNPYLGFNNKDAARAAQLKSAEARKANAAKKAPKTDHRPTPQEATEATEQA